MTLPRAGTWFAFVATWLFVSFAAHLFRRLYSVPAASACRRPSSVSIRSGEITRAAGIDANHGTVGTRPHRAAEATTRSAAVSGSIIRRPSRTGPVGRRSRRRHRRAGSDRSSLRGGVGHDILSGGTGTDELDLSTSPRAAPRKPGSTTGVGRGTGSGPRNRRRCRGSSFDDSLTGDRNGNQLIGGPDDAPDGGAGNHWLEGDAGRRFGRRGTATTRSSGGDGDQHHGR